MNDKKIPDAGSNPLQPVSVAAVQLEHSSITPNFTNPAPLSASQLSQMLTEHNIKLTVTPAKVLESINRINPAASLPTAKLPEDIQRSIPALKPEAKRFHGAKVSLAWFPFPLFSSPCSDMFGYMSPASTRAATKLPFNATIQALLDQLGGLMGTPGRESGIVDSAIPAGFTYVGQFVDHDITLDVSSSLNAVTDANTINNIRTPALDLESVYGRGPALDPYLYVFSAAEPSTAIKFQLGTNRNTGSGGPGGAPASHRRA